MLFVEEDHVCGKNGVRGPQLQDVVILGGGSGEGVGGRGGLTWDL